MITTARYYGFCPIPPSSRLTVTRWFESPGGHIVLLEFADQNGVRWLGPELPRDMAHSGSMVIQTSLKVATVSATTIDACSGWTELRVDWV